MKQLMAAEGPSSSYVNKYYENVRLIFIFFGLFAHKYTKFQHFVMAGG